METQSESFKRAYAKAKKRKQDIKKAMRQLADRFGSRFPKNYSRRPDASLALFVLDDEKDLNTAEQLKDEAEQFLKEALVKAGWTKTDAKRVKVACVAKDGLES